MEPFHPVAAQIESILKDGGFWYERFEHEPVRTSEEAARVRPEYSLKQGAKALIVRAKKAGQGKKFIMIVVPGDSQFDAKKLKETTGYTDVRFGTEEEVSELTQGIIPGGVPPFGTLFGLEVIADKAVFENERIIFNAGDRRVSIGMRSQDYLTIISPQIVDIAKPSST